MRKHRVLHKITFIPRFSVCSSVFFSLFSFSNGFGRIRFFFELKIEIFPRKLQIKALILKYSWQFIRQLICVPSFVRSLARSFGGLCLVGCVLVLKTLLAQLFSCLFLSISLSVARVKVFYFIFYSPVPLKPKTNVSGQLTITTLITKYF